MAQLYPVSGISTLLKLSPRRIQQLVKDGILPRPKSGLYDPIGCVHAYLDYLKKLIAGGGELSLTDERTRLTKYQADLAEIELRKSRAEIIARDDAERIWGNILTITKQKFLSLGVRLGPVLLKKSSIAELKEMIDDAVYEVLSELEHSAPPDATGGQESLQEGDELLPPPTKIHRERVGRSPSKAQPRKQRRARTVAHQ